MLKCSIITIPSLRNFIYGCILVFLSVSNTACMQAGWTGANVFYSRHRLRESLDNQALAIKIERQLQKDYPQYPLDAKVVYARVLLTGRVPNKTIQKNIGNLVTQLAAPHKVYNAIEVGQPRTVISKINDAWLSTKVKLKLLTHNHADTTAIQIITEDHTVYLMGRATAKEKAAAVNIAKNTSGVQKVVPLLAMVET